MLDVMRKPPPVAEVIQWKACRVEVPSDGRTVLVWAPEDSGGNNVWLGYYARPDEDDVDEEDDPDDLAEWTNIDGLGRIEVYWWADMPKFPGEPGAQACKFGDPLCPCPDGDPCHYEGKDAWRSKGAAQAPTEEPHIDDRAVDALAIAMKAKLARKRGQGYGGWGDADADDVPMGQHLSDLLRAHVDKGDPVDVANFCAFLAYRGERIASRTDGAAEAEPAS